MRIFEILFATLLDILPIAAIIFGFQFLVIRKRVTRLPSVILGFGMVLVGLSLFLLGLELALFPIGEIMAAQLASPDFLPALAEDAGRHWRDYFWVYLFAFAIGASTTIAEPALIAVSLKAGQISGGTINPFLLRLAVAVGVAFGIALGAWRIVVGYPLHWLVIGAYLILIVQTTRCPKIMIPLAYDSGGVTTSTVTVPIVASLGLGLASSIDGRSPVLDGFGLIALASLFPIISVMAYAQIAEWRNSRQDRSSVRPAE